MKKLMLCIAFILAGCEVTPQDRIDYRNQQAVTLAEDLSYFKDDRTDVCFAAIYVGGHGTSVSVVPCSFVGDGVTHFRSKEK